MITSYLTVACISSIFISLVIKLLKHFGRGGDLKVYFITPLLTYSGGFVLRLSKDKSLIDIGFYLTDYSLMFTYTLFAVAVLLGQLRYWKK